MVRFISSADNIGKMSDEIISGLRNALERGESLDKAAQTFLSAGYNPNDVRESVNAISSGALHITTPTASEPPKTQPMHASVAPQAPQLPMQALQQVQQPKQKGKHIGLIIVLVVILLILIGGLITVMVAGENILKFMSGFLK